jgi:hypothetical protein
MPDPAGKRDDIGQSVDETGAIDDAPVAELAVASTAEREDSASFVSASAWYAPALTATIGPTPAGKETGLKT